MIPTHFRTDKAKLSPELVREIRRHAKEGSTNREISRFFNVKPNTISNVLSGRTWSWVDTTKEA